MQIKDLNSLDEIASSFSAFLELRPALSDVRNFTAQVMDQQKEGYKIFAVIANEEVAACIGFRIITMLAWGRVLYIDDLITREKYRKKGCGRILLDHIVTVAKDNECNQIHLDTGYARHTAHRFYLNHGFEFHCHHLALKLR